MPKEKRGFTPRRRVAERFEAKQSVHSIVNPSTSLRLCVRNLPRLAAGSLSWLQVLLWLGVLGGKFHALIHSYNAMQQLRKMKVVFFDAAETLMFLPRPVGEHYAEVAGRFGLTLESAALDRAFRAAWKAMPPRMMTGDGGPQPDDDKGWWRELVRLVFHGDGPSGVHGVLTETVAQGHKSAFDFEKYFDVIYDHFAEPGVWHAFPDVADVLEKLRAQGLRLGVISNFDRRLFANLEDIGLASYFDHITISSEVGADKPHARIFERALGAFGVAPDEAMHVGDDPVRDWAGAEAVGLRVFRLERPRNDLRALLID